MNEPILTTLGVEIGCMFKHNDIIWTRTDRYSAKSIEYGSCRFGYLGENNGETDSEWQDYLDNSVVLDMIEVTNLIKWELQ